VSTAASDTIKDFNTPESLSDALLQYTSQFANVRLIQRDYIWDFSFDDISISLLFNCASPTSIIKNIIPADGRGLDTISGIEVERMTPDRYRIRRIPAKTMSPARMNMIIVNPNQGIPVAGVPNAYICKQFGVCIYSDTTCFVGPITQEFDITQDVKTFVYINPSKLHHVWGKYYLMHLDSTGPEIYALVQVSSTISPLIRLANKNLWNTVLTLLTYKDRDVKPKRTTGYGR
jgi:hypothetical protein